MFFEVPTSPRQMIWSADKISIPEAFLDAYLESHHHFKDGVKTVKMDYETQTGCAYFQLNVGTNVGTGEKKGKKDDPNDVLARIKWQDEDADGLDDGFSWRTSREYILDHGLGSKTLSLNFDMTASIELMWTLGSAEAALERIDSITAMQLHLSDEARGLPPIVQLNPRVPDAGSAALLLGLGFLGLAGVKRKLCA